MQAQRSSLVWYSMPTYWMISNTVRIFVGVSLSKPHIVNLKLWMKDSTSMMQHHTPHCMMRMEFATKAWVTLTRMNYQVWSWNCRHSCTALDRSLLNLYSCPTPASPLYIIAQLSSTVYTSGYNLHSILQYLNQICLTVSCILIVLFLYILSQFPCRSLSFIRG